MSNFFTRSKEDMKYYLRIKKSFLRKNEKEKGVAGVHLLVLY